MRPVAVRTVKQAGAWLDRVGIALLFARPDVVLPSLWEAVSGDASAPWAIRDADGAFVRWSEAAGICWGLKDELPERGVACVGRHAGGNAVALVAPWALPLLYALTGRAGSETDFRGAVHGVELEVAEAVLAEGPLSGPQLRTIVGVHVSLIVLWFIFYYPLLAAWPIPWPYYNWHIWFSRAWI